MELTRRKPQTIKLGVNHKTKRLDVVVVGEGGGEAKGSLSIDEIDTLMARLSQRQYALVLSEHGTELSLSEDATISFREAAKIAWAKLDAVADYQTGVEDLQSAVVLLISGSTGRLTGYRMSPEKARTLALALQNAADQIPARPNRRFDA
jgi:hypothetical protein